MGYRYQNKLDEENERCRWEHRPRWQRKLVRGAEVIGLSFFALFLLYSSFGWIVRLLIHW